MIIGAKIVSNEEGDIPILKTEEQPHAPLPCFNSLRCGAKTRQGTSCRSPAVHDRRRCRMHGGAVGSGAPLHNANALKHGYYAAEAIKQRREIKALIKNSHRLLDDCLSL
jgi:hypothetical protein